jgi:uncharacterized protein
MIFVDSGAWFARFVPDDPNHAAMVDWFLANSEPLVTTDYCVDETLTLLVARKRPKLALEVGQALFDETVARLHFLLQVIKSDAVGTFPAAGEHWLELH